MSYGLDFSDVRYETDHAGNRLRVTVPYSMFSALTEFWIAARRAQTARLEASTRPGQFKGSLQAAQIATPPPAEPPPKPVSAHPSDRKWNALIASLPEHEHHPDITVAPAASPESSTAPPAGPAVPRSAHPRVFYREFSEAPPPEVTGRIERGVYFIRAWREYRGLTLADAAELLGRDKTTIVWHESGKNPPSPATLARFAQIYDCPAAQLTLKPGSDTSPFDATRRTKPKAEQVNEAVNARRPHRQMVEPRSPADTDYPNAVLAHLMAGKSPMLAWRLYRGLSLKALAQTYGGREGNIKAMEANSWLRPATIDKLCPIFHCKPAQLLRPVGMPTRHQATQEGGNLPAQADAAPVVLQPPQTNGCAHSMADSAPPAASAMEAAFLQAASQERHTDKQRARTSRLARVQAELTGI
jgi:transcriptional regulator with XRE-family HTH domain